MLNWQELLSIAVALTCGIWLVRKLILPFFLVNIGKCGGCLGSGCEVEKIPESSGDFLQILPE